MLCLKSLQDIVEDRPGYKSGHEVEEVLTEASDFSTAYTEDYEDTFEDDQAAGGAADDLFSNRNESTLYDDDSFVPEESNASLVSTVVDSSTRKDWAIKSLRGSRNEKAHAEADKARCNKESASSRA